jgi:hypothetical protein
VRSVLLGILGGGAILALPGGVLFGCAGRWDLPWFWAYLGVWAASTLLGTIVIDPTLIRERVRPGSGGQDHLGAAVFVPIWAGQHVVAGLDVGRFHWSDGVPVAVQGVALLAMWPWPPPWRWWSGPWLSIASSRP